MPLPLALLPLPVTLMPLTLAVSLPLMPLNALPRVLLVGLPHAPSLATALAPPKGPTAPVLPSSALGKAGES